MSRHHPLTLLPVSLRGLLPPCFLALAISCTSETAGGEPSPGDDDDAAGDDDDAPGDDDDAPGNDDDDDGSTGTGTGADPNACVPGVDDCEDGFKCQPYVKEEGACCVDANQCVPVQGTKAYGEPCTRERYNDDCGRDLFCFAGTSGKEGPGFCKQLCDGTNPDSCADKGLPQAQCIPYNNGVSPWCETPCHPLRPACEDGEGCYAVLNTFMCARPDPEPGKGKPGDDCNTVQSCNPGAACIYADFLVGCESEQCCTIYCDATGDGSECTAPAVCRAMFSEDDAGIDPQHLDVGYCGLADEGD